MKHIVLIFISISLIFIFSCKKKENPKTINPSMKVLTTPVVSVSKYGCVTGGTVVSGITITEKGVCYSIYPGPNHSSVSTSIFVSGTGSGVFTCNLTGLIPGNIYYVRAYAKSSTGEIQYGYQLQFQTIMYEPAGTVKDTCGNIYNAIKIGHLTWMKENLKTVKFNDGTPIPEISNDSEWQSTNTSAYCDYNNDLNTAEIYGKLYNGFTVTDTKNICPKGWHVPTDVEFDTLVNFLGGSNIAGNKLRKTGNAHWLNTNNEATNLSGFSALPGGYRSTGGSFSQLGYVFKLWTKGTTQLLSPDITTSGNIYNTYYSNQFGISTRCVKN